MNHRLRLLSAFLFVIAGGSMAVAQFGTETGLQATGTATLERPPQVMRMSIDLLAKGSDAADAIAKLKARRQTASAALEKLGAIKDSVKLGDVSIDESRNDRQAQMQMMMMQRMAQRRGQRSNKAKPPEVAVKVKMNLTAEFPLKTTDAADLLVESKTLQDALKAADLAGVKEAQELTPEEAEEAEEAGDMAEMEMAFGGDDQSKPGDPTFLFVARVAEADRDKVLAEAVSDAKSDAAQLAKAASLKLGALRSIQATVGNSLNDDYADYSSYGGRYAAYRQMASRDNESEAVGPTAGSLKYRIVVQVSYDVSGQ